MRPLRVLATWIALTGAAAGNTGAGASRVHTDTDHAQPKPTFRTANIIWDATVAHSVASEERDSSRVFYEPGALVINVDINHQAHEAAIGHQASLARSLRLLVTDHHGEAVEVDTRSTFLVIDSPTRQALAVR